MKKIFPLIKKDLNDALKHWDTLWPMIGVPAASSLLLYSLLINKLGKNLIFPGHLDFGSDILTKLYQLLGFSHLDPQSAYTLVLLNTVYFYILTLTAVALPIILSSTCIVTEKEQGTIENLFMLPINDRSLLIAKVLSSTLPSFVLIFIYFSSVIIFISIKFDFEIAKYILTAKWCLLHFIILPIYILLSAWLGICISVKLNSSRSALTFSFLLILPLIFIIIPIMNGIIIFNLQLTIVAIIIGLFLLIAAMFLAIHLFNRDKIIRNYR